MKLTSEQKARLDPSCVVITNNGGSNFLAYQARYNQLEIGYGADVWSMRYLRSGELVYGGLPGPSAFYTDLRTVLASGEINLPCSKVYKLDLIL